MRKKGEGRREKVAHILLLKCAHSLSAPIGNDI